jgi:hypothetical protein
MNFLGPALNNAFHHASLQRHDVTVYGNLASTVPKSTKKSSCLVPVSVNCCHGEFGKGMSTPEISHLITDSITSRFHYL